MDKGKPGDYVFFMFGHNENKNDYNSSNLEEYGLFHEQIIRAVKAKGMIPVVVTPVARPWLNGGVATDSHGEYPETAIAAAEKYGTPYIDIDSLTRASLEKVGSAGISQYYNPGDTHTTLAGADWVVGLMADQLRTMNLPISEFLK